MLRGTVGVARESPRPSTRRGYSNKKCCPMVLRGWMCNGWSPELTAGPKGCARPRDTDAVCHLYGLHSGEVRRRGGSAAAVLRRRCEAQKHSGYARPHGHRIIDHLSCSLPRLLWKLHENIPHALHTPVGGIFTLCSRCLAAFGFRHSFSNQLILMAFYGGRDMD
jgi:hypothetical protein